VNPTALNKGDVDRLRRFWLTGVCKPYKEERQFSEPLSTEQFLSAFLLLLSGIGLAFLLLGLEHIYFHSIRPHLTSPTTGACCSLISIVSSPSLWPGLCSPSFLLHPSIADSFDLFLG
jgi:ionotropic glutamate receptor NMDA 2B